MTLRRDGKRAAQFPKSERRPGDVLHALAKSFVTNLTLYRDDAAIGFDADGQMFGFADKPKTEKNESLLRFIVDDGRLAGLTMGNVVDSLTFRLD